MNDDTTRTGAIKRRLLILGALIIVASVIVLSDTLHDRSEQIIVLIESLIAEYPVFGIVSFIMLAMVSAMVAFFSSAIIVPVGVYAWGGVSCFVLLWIGWLLGGIASFWLGRWFGRPVVAQIVGEERLAAIDKQVGQRARFSHVVLLQAALPSEVPGYVLGTTQYSFSQYLLALALVELPYAIATVYLGASFIERQAGPFILVSLAALLGVAALYYLYQRISGREGPGRIQP